MMVLIDRQVLILIGIFVISLSLLGGVYLNFPKLEPDERVHVKLPKNIEDAKQLGLVLSRYRKNNFIPVIGGVLVTYIFLQSFAIPGSIFLSILSGYLFAFPVALLLVCTCSAVGAAICYLLSLLVGKRLVEHYFPDRVDTWCKRVSRHRDNLLYYMLFLRITPFLPNWFINISAPVLDVPIGPFFWGTFFGVAPPSFFFIQAGKTLNTMTESGVRAISWHSVVILGVFAFLSLLPVFCKERLRRKLE